MGIGHPKKKEIKEVIKEKKLIGAPRAIKAKQDRIIDKQQAKSLCQITTKELMASGFLCSISDINNPNIKYPVLITNNHVLGEEQIKPDKEIKIYFTDQNDNKIYKKIKIDKTRTTYTVGKFGEEDIDATIIELRPDDDELNDLEFLDIDKELMSENVKEAYESKDVYVIHYERGEEVAKSFGKINEVIKEGKSYSLIHTCDTDEGSSGSPIILYNHNVIGIHRGGVKDEDFNAGTLLQYPIKEYCKKLKEEKDTRENKIDDNINEKEDNINEIRITYEIYQKESFRVLGEEFVKKNKRYCKLLINKKNHSICEYINYEEYGINKADNFITIILTEIKTDKFTDLSYMFCGCDLLSSLDFQSFNTKKVTNMSGMFIGLSNLKSFNLSSFNTQNVTNMNCMFDGCNSLTSLNLT